ncbi:alkaline phosphatase D family protein [Galbibacter mesophilus]|uniref:alkaline phosphatase D family protein n=1 Tax=Galbibacter mesophilus TaxID=379069 RepID=UPI002044010D|nr:alkaline phosphatase D family protein [Galbibacter mesophilus]MCM5662737.1 alkaline phosphatase D family protein [Galbibacter mesophilus]
MPFISTPFGSVFANESLGVFNEVQKSDSFSYDFKGKNDRIWIGNDFLTKPLEDWRQQDGKLTFTGAGNEGSVYVLTHVLTGLEGNFKMQASLGLKNVSEEGIVGFSLGVQDKTDPSSIKAACYHGEGLFVGVSTSGKAILGEKEIKLPNDFSFERFTIKIEVSNANSRTKLAMNVIDGNGLESTIEEQLDTPLKGLVALQNGTKKIAGVPLSVENLSMEGTMLESVPENSFGPILWSMYTLSNNILKITAQLPPIGEKDSQKVQLYLSQNRKWKKAASATIDTDAYTAIFSIDDWNASEEVPYKLVYKIDGERHEYKGTIANEPKNEILKFGALTCQHYDAYPYRPLVENLEKSNPDMLYFSGDQLYEYNGGYHMKREPEDMSILSYLGKWYMFGWAFGNLMKNRPTICTPDDHDVFQGNLWGENGELISLEDWKKSRDAHGGFVQTPKMVNVVNKTQCGHLPAPFNKEKLPSGMTTWYTDINYGGMSFAVISDRIFKSGPEIIRKGDGRIDHIKKRLSPNELESNELSFLGENQMEFLEKWVEDWQNVSMKVLLSQTLFANVGTHHGNEKQFLHGDMDSGGWPKQQRDEVLRLIRKANAFHINGDQHLPFMVKYAIDESQDAGWTFCSPAISTGYPRWGQPDLVNIPYTNRPAHNLPNTGNYRDVFGNDNFIYAVGNPDDDFSEESNRYKKAQKKASGYGLVSFNTKDRTIKMEAIRFLANLELDKPEQNTYPGWPLTIHQLDNDGRKAVGYLPILNFKKVNSLLKIYHQETGELIQAIRVSGNEFKPKVFELGMYTLVIGEVSEEKKITDVNITNDPNEILEC